MKIGGISKAWTAEEVKIAATIYNNSHKSARPAICQKISDAIGRTWWAVSKRLSDCGRSFDARQRDARAQRRKVETATFIKPPDNVIRERDYRAGLQHTSLTEAYFGDPLPGYSALDRKQQIATLPKRPKISAAVQA
jgi:hypothetical protein